MSKGRLIAVCIGIAVAVAFSVGFAIYAQSGQTGEMTVTSESEGKHFEVELKENVGIKTNPPKP